MLNLVKKSLKDVTISEYYYLQEILNDEMLSETNKTMELVEFFTGSSQDELLNTDLNEYNSTVAKINEMFENIATEEFKPVDNIVIDGVKYKLIKDLSKITVAQYIDFQTYIHEDKNIARVLSVFLVPDGKKYGEGYDVIKTIQDLNEHLSIVTANQLQVFFSQSLKKSMKRSLIYYKWIMKMMMWKTNMPKKLRNNLSKMVDLTIKTTGCTL